MLDLDYPFRGAWSVRNSPANRVPSHGTSEYGSAHAIDFVPVDDAGRSAPFTAGSLWRPEPPQRFPGFGRAVLAPVRGVVIARHDGEPDHDSYRGLPSITYALTQGRRAAGGWSGLAGNHVMIQLERGEVVVLCHLQRDSLQVTVGDEVRAGDVVAACGNSGNSTEPHLHVQAISGPDPAVATAIPISFGGKLPRNRHVVQVP